MIAPQQQWLIKVWCLKAHRKANCNAAKQFGNAMDSQLRAQKESFRIKSLPQDFQNHHQMHRVEKLDHFKQAGAFFPTKVG